MPVIFTDDGEQQKSHLSAMFVSDKCHSNVEPMKQASPPLHVAGKSILQQ